MLRLDKLFTILRQLDLSETEIKVFVELLKNDAITGYEVSKLSSVPRSRVYSILEGLIKKGFVICSKSDSPKYYTTIPREELIFNKKTSYDDIMNDLDSELAKYNQTINLDHIWLVKGYDNMFNKCRNIIKNTKEELFIQVWRQDVDEIYKEVKKIEALGVKSIVILYSSNNDYEIDFKNMYKHGYEKEKIEDLGGRWISIVSDSKEMVFGFINESNNIEAVSTQNSALVFLSKEYIKHDAYCLKLIRNTNRVDSDDLKSTLNDIRNIYEI